MDAGLQRPSPGARPGARPPAPARPAPRQQPLRRGLGRRVRPVAHRRERGERAVELLDPRLLDPRRDRRPHPPAPGAKAGSSVGAASTACSSASRRPIARGEAGRQSAKPSSPSAPPARSAAHLVDVAAQSSPASSPSRRPGCGRSPARSPACRGVAVGADAHDLAEQRRDVGDSRARSDSAPSRPRDGCRRRPGAQLQHQLVADDQRAVGLLGRQPADLRHPAAARTPPCATVGRNRISPSSARQRAAGRAARRSGPAASSSSAKASVRKPTRRPRRTRASASCCGSAGRPSSSQAMPSGSR